ncbi:acyloxyacyl hydrolase [Candidatus Pelagibacter sp.]|nr:acyloxyacyl hydrolase [Candidatus Pelagibacter sp.]
MLSIGLMEALILSPEDYKQSDAVRIMYVHVPAAWISYNHISNASLGDKNPGANSYMFNFFKNF